MKIKRKYQIHLAASKGDSRPSLEQVWIFRLLSSAVVRLIELNDSYKNGTERPDWYEEWPRVEKDTVEFIPDNDNTNGVAVATNGFVLSVVPVELLPEDVAGPVSASLMEKAFKLKKKELVTGTYDFTDYVHMALKSDAITLGDGATYNRDTDIGQCPNFFPIATDIIRALDNDKEKEAERWVPFVDINNLVLVSKTLGRLVRPSAGGQGVCLISGPQNSSPIFVKDDTVPINMLDLMKVPFALIMPLHTGR